MFINIKNFMIQDFNFENLFIHFHNLFQFINFILIIALYLFKFFLKKKYIQKKKINRTHVFR